MIKELVKVANRLDNLRLFKEADLLDFIIRKISTDYESLLKPFTSLEDCRKLINEAVRPSSQEECDYNSKKVIDIFKNSCDEMIDNVMEKLSIDKSDIEKYLMFIDPRDSMEGLKYFFDDNDVEELYEFKQSYSPSDILDALDEVINNKSITSFTPIQNRAKKLKENLIKVLNQKFKINI